MSAGGQQRPSARKVSWRRTGSGEHPYEAEVDGERWVLRVNDFPAEPMYTVLVDGERPWRIWRRGWPEGWEQAGGEVAS